MFKLLWRHLGLVVSVLATCTSLVLSLKAAYEPELGWASALLVLIACFSEPTKILANRVIWQAVSATRLQRLMAAVWYALCITASIGLLHLLMEKQIQGRAQADRGQAAQAAQAEADWERRRAELREDLRRAEEAAEEARGQVLAGVRTVSAIQNLLASRDAPGARERKLLEQELNSAQLNAQREGRATRADERSTNLRKLLGDLEAERSAALTRRSVGAHAHSAVSAPSAASNLSALAILSALLIELAISGGIWVDTICHRTPEEQKAKSEEKQSVSSLSAQLPALQAVPVHAERFEEWLQLEWKKCRTKDGWLEGTERAWATASGASSSGFVHEQLARMSAAGAIEKRSSPRKTWIRFIKVAKLKFAK